MRKKTKLANICDLIDEKILLNKIINHNLFKMNYISTENMLPDKNGIIPPTILCSQIFDHILKRYGLQRMRVLVPMMY